MITTGVILILFVLGIYAIAALVESFEDDYIECYKRRPKDLH